VSGNGSGLDVSVRGNRVGWRIRGEPAASGEGCGEPEDERFVARECEESGERVAVEDAGTDAEGEEDEWFEATAAAVDGPCAGEEEADEEELGGGADLAVVVERGDPDTVGVVGGPADFGGGGIWSGPAFSEEPFLVVGEAAEDDAVEVDAAGVAAVDPAFEALLGEEFEIRVGGLGGEEAFGGVGADLFCAPCEGGGD